VAGPHANSRSELHHPHSALVDQLPDATGHACINVLRKATQTMRLRLSEATLVSTLEPCRMCAEAARLCGVREVVFGAYDLRDGGYSTGRTTDDTVVKGGVLGDHGLGEAITAESPFVVWAACESAEQVENVGQLLTKALEEYGDRVVVKAFSASL
jgi:tRNA(Arg) A34 adenosine deaminase TadA